MPNTKKGNSSKSHLANIYNAQKQIRALKRQHRKALRKELIGVYEDALLLEEKEIEELYNHSFWDNRAGRKPKLQDGEIVRTSIIFAHDARIEEENKPAMEQGNAFQFLANQGVDSADVEKFLTGKAYRDLSKAYVESKREVETGNENGSATSSNKGDTHVAQAEDDGCANNDADDQHGRDDPKEVKGRQASPAASPAAWAAPKITGLSKIELNGKPELVEETTPLEKGDRVRLEAEVRKTTSGKPYLKLIEIRIASTKVGKGSQRRKIDPRRLNATSQHQSRNQGKDHSQKSW